LLNELKIKPLREAIADSIRESIISGKLKPGERVMETSMAKILGVSRTPTREAFLQLDSEGFLEVMPRKGAIVTNLSARNAKNIYDVRSALEGLAARLTAEYINDQTIDELIYLNDQMKNYAEKNTDNHKKIIGINHQFHDVINKSSQNDKLYQMLDLLRKQTMRYNQIYLSFIQNLKRSIEDHTKIIKALKTRSGSLAEDIMRKHVDAAGEALVKLIEEK
jgi:DNA-binding GntR family transcriptional regulator